MRPGELGLAPVISRSRRVDWFHKFANWQSNRLQIRLAVSLHGASDDVRSRIMPINRKYNLSALLDACRYFTSRKKQRITFEFILIAEVNDSDEQARQLAKHARALEAKLNLIPYNKVEGLDWTQPSSDRQKKFLAVLRAADVRATPSPRKGR